MTSLAAAPTSAWARVYGRLERSPIWFVAAGLLLAGTVGVSDFAGGENISNLLRQGAALGIVSVGQTVVLLAGGIDLSVGSLMSLVVVVSSVIMNGRPEMIGPAVAVCLLIGLAVGAFNGAMIVTTRIYPLLQTFGMLSILQGVVFVLTDRTVGAAPPEFQQLAYGSIGPLPTPALLLAAVIMVGWLLMRVTPFGRYVYAVGGSAENARRAGVRTRSVTVAVYILSALLATVAGLVVAAQLGTGYTLAGSGFMIDSIVAVVIGGTALSGGRGGVGGTIAGVIVLVVIGNLLNLLAIPAFVQQIVNGLIVVGVVALYGLAELKRRAQ